jgi:hypothetical protein
MASHAVRSAPGRSEREAGAIVDLGLEGKGEGTLNVIAGLVPEIPMAQGTALLLRVMAGTGPAMTRRVQRGTECAVICR